MTVPEAVEVSKKHLTDLLPELAETDIQLEEVDVPPLGQKWKFTFSAMPMLPANSSFGKILRATRVAKSVEIDPLNGDLISLRNAAA